MNNMNMDCGGLFAQIKLNAAAVWQSLQEQLLIMVGTATCGRAAGALETLNIIKRELTEQCVNAAVIEVGCMGHCYAEPLVIIKKPGMPAICYGYVTGGLASTLVREYVAGDDPCIEFALAALEVNDLIPTFDDFPRGAVEKKIIMEQCGLIDPGNIDHYLAHGGYGALAGALRLPGEKIIEEIRAAGLRGRGGAGFPTGVKWETCRKSGGDTKYVICNADEGDPGAFMDRALLESNPHQVLEGLALAAYAVGADKGYFYIRSEYPLAVKRIRLAIEQAKARGLLGRLILGSDFNLELDVFEGSGAFVCGEETALLASMEGKPGLPRHRPPFPAQAGLHGQPTIINNVKTLSYVPHITRRGAEWFKKTGTTGSPGTAIFALAGKIINTGWTEVPMGTTLNQLVYEVGSGVEGGKELKAVQIGGPSGGCLPRSLLETPIDFDSLNQAGAMMGSGGLIVLDEDDCMVEIARYFLDFTQRESCGKCTFCRLGTKQMLDILERVTRGEGQLKDLDNILGLAKNVKSGSLCNLGKTAPNPVLSTLRHFRDEYVAHIEEKRCPSLMCMELIAYYILPDRCERSCDACVGSCPVDSIFPNQDRIKVIDQKTCVKCRSCMDACPPQYSAVIKLSPPSLLPEKEYQDA